MYNIVENGGFYDVVYSGEVLESFASLADAQDYLVCIIHERDMAFAEVGCEFDEPWLD